MILGILSDTHGYFHPALAEYLADVDPPSAIRYQPSPFKNSRSQRLIFINFKPFVHNGSASHARDDHTRAADRTL